MLERQLRKACPAWNAQVTGTVPASAPCLSLQGRCHSVVQLSGGSAHLFSMCGSTACVRRMGANALISRRASATWSEVSAARACCEAPVSAARSNSGMQPERAPHCQVTVALCSNCQDRSSPVLQAHEGLNECACPHAHAHRVHECTACRQRSSCSTQYPCPMRTMHCLQNSPAKQTSAGGRTTIHAIKVLEVQRLSCLQPALEASQLLSSCYAPALCIK
jgi:hypothetical protein